MAVAFEVRERAREYAAFCARETGRDFAIIRYGDIEHEKLIVRDAAKSLPTTGSAFVIETVTGGR